jgi:hypothetical protein
MKITFSFERMKKTLSHGVIPAIAFATHALLNMMFFEQSPMFNPSLDLRHGDWNHLLENLNGI